MKFEWDEQKNTANIQKHGISFEQAQTIFDRTILSHIDDRFDYRETRELSFGVAADGDAVLAVAHTLRGEKVRIISARHASAKERGFYYAYVEKHANKKDE